jgi:N-acetylglucosaminyldiphosphoundecaprenol N-acetyl-beta-D-mannosaminyltransferase
LMKTDVLGVKFDNIELSEAVERGLELIGGRKAAYAVTPNPEIVMAAGKDPALMSALNAADIVLPDGIGVVYAAKILGTPLKTRVPGIDFACGLIKALSESGGSIYLFGAKPGVAEKAAENLSAQFPGIRVCGTHDGYFRDDADIIADINAKGPDFLMVCLGAPKQELWMQQNAGKLNAGIMAGLGGCLDVFAGNVDRAPEKMQKMGLEWLYRLYKEPSRIGRMAKLPGILFKSAGRRMRGRRDE